jgi:hypothetical protein
MLKHHLFAAGAVAINAEHLAVIEGVADAGDGTVEAVERGLVAINSFAASSRFSAIHAAIDSVFLMLPGGLMLAVSSAMTAGSVVGSVSISNVQIIDIIHSPKKPALWPAVV